MACILKISALYFYKMPYVFFCTKNTVFTKALLRRKQCMPDGSVLYRFRFW